MKITKKIDGYTIEVNSDEYDALKRSLAHAYGYSMINGQDGSEYGKLCDELIDAKKRYLTEEEVAPIVNCMCCKYCLPPFKRKGGKMCSLEECNFVKA